MSVTRTLLLGIRSHLIVSGVTATIVVGKDLPSTPDQAVSLGLYDSDDDTTVARSTRLMQAMCRGKAGDSLSGDDLADQIFDILHGLEGLWINDLHVASCSRTSMVPLGTDTNGRPTRADNYELIVDEPSTPRRPF